MFKLSCRLLSSLSDEQTNPTHASPWEEEVTGSPEVVTESQDEDESREDIEPTKTGTYGDTKPHRAILVYGGTT